MLVKFPHLGTDSPKHGALCWCAPLVLKRHEVEVVDLAYDEDGDVVPVTEEHLAVYVVHFDTAITQRSRGRKGWSIDPARATHR